MSEIDHGISLSEQIICLSRELAIREKVYPKWVKAGTMPAYKAAYEIECISAALATLTKLREETDHA